MKNRLIRLGLGASLVVAASAPMTAPAQAWSCTGEVGYAACFVVGTSCQAFERAGGNGEICQLS